jgi:hypothetical protein
MTVVSSTSRFGSPLMRRILIHSWAVSKPAAVIAASTVMLGETDSMGTPCTLSFQLLGGLGVSGFAGWGFSAFGGFGFSAFAASFSGTVMARFLLLMRFPIAKMQSSCVYRRSGSQLQE